MARFLQLPSLEKEGWQPLRLTGWFDLQQPVDQNPSRRGDKANQLNSAKSNNANALPNHPQTGTLPICQFVPGTVPHFQPSAGTRKPLRPLPLKAIFTLCPTQFTKNFFSIRFRPILPQRGKTTRLSPQSSNSQRPRSPEQNVSTIAHRPTISQENFGPFRKLPSSFKEGWQPLRLTGWFALRLFKSALKSSLLLCRSPRVSKGLTKNAANDSDTAAPTLSFAKSLHLHVKTHGGDHKMLTFILTLFFAGDRNFTWEKVQEIRTGH